MIGVPVNTTLLLLAATAATASPMRDATRAVIKLYGAGGYARVEAYQTAVLIEGHPYALTAETTLLDSDTLVAVTGDGLRREATVARIDRRLGIAWLDLGPGSDQLPRLAANQSQSEALLGETVGVISNAFGVAAGGERPTVQAGIVMASSTADALQLETVSGASPLPGRTPLLLLDVVCSNPGAAGGAVVDREGRLIALVGAERRSAATGGWLNYAIPIDIVLNGGSPQASPDEPLPSSSIVRDPFGIILAPPITEKMPPYITHLRAGSVALAAGLMPDDLIVAIDGGSVSTRRDALRALSRAVAAENVVRIEVLRGDELLSLRLPGEPGQ